MLCLRVPAPFFTPSAAKPLLRLNRSLTRRAYSPSSPSNFTTFKMSSSNQTVEHIVLFKVKDGTDPSKVASMIGGLNGLISLDRVLHLTAGPIHRNRSSPFAFTHALHSRYRTKEDLSAYSAHPNHLGVVKESVLPICDDIMAVDWIADDLDGPVVPAAGSAMRVTFLKLKEGLGDAEKGEVFGAIRGVKDSLESINQLSLGENFSPERAKGYSIASVAIFPGLGELDGLNSEEEMVKLQKEKVRDFLESVIVFDYVIPPPQSASL
ncbi:stress-response A/B barrel domain-containing protein UP3-like [Malania oleifera]|uniref:stress-response A/B barrel domain-containing protein UP3-like n=1 Tax=Malania oleifera TaxID=397392 RepID=UPI0025AE718A|nr:stress-response A/B barrel domain-containing protein UP3-like [Malania oleifera]